MKRLSKAKAENITEYKQVVFIESGDKFDIVENTDLEELPGWLAHNPVNTPEFNGPPVFGSRDDLYFDGDFVFAINWDVRYISVIMVTGWAISQDEAEKKYREWLNGAEPRTTVQIGPSSKAQKVKVDIDIAQALEDSDLLAYQEGFDDFCDFHSLNVVD